MRTPTNRGRTLARLERIEAVVERMRGAARQPGMKQSLILAGVLSRLGLSDIGLAAVFALFERWPRPEHVQPMDRATAERLKGSMTLFTNYDAGRVSAFLSMMRGGPTTA